MSFFDYFRQEYIKGKVIDKYSLSNGNLGLILEDLNSDKRYHVEFRDGCKGPSIDNLFGLLREPFSSKTGYIDKLINKGDTIDMALSYSKGPFRQAYKIYSVSGKSPYKMRMRSIDLPYKYFRLSQYKV
jgi:hypothetical protein